LPIRVRFLIEGEEESGSPNLGRLLALEPGLTDADGALKEGGAIDSRGHPLLSLGGKGILYCHFKVRTMSRDAHSGGATHYPNAAWRLAHAFASLMDANGHVQIGGFYDDVRKPTTAEREMLDRMPFDPDAERIAKLLRAHLDRCGFGDVEFSAEEGEHPYRGPADAPLVRAVAGVAEEAFGKPAVLVPSSGGTSPMWVVCNAKRMANVT